MLDPLSKTLQSTLLRGDYRLLDTVSRRDRVLLVIASFACRKTERLWSRRLPPVHSGEILLHDFLEPLRLRQNALAQALGVTPMRVSQIVRGQRATTADTALRLARYFGTQQENSSVQEGVI